MNAIERGNPGSDQLNLLTAGFNHRSAALPRNAPSSKAPRPAALNVTPDVNAAAYSNLLGQYAV